MSGENGAGKVGGRLAPGRLVHPVEAARIEAEVRRLFDEGIDELVPRLARLMRRPTWKFAEQREYKMEVEVMIAEVLEWARAEIQRVAIPGVRRDSRMTRR